MGRKAAGSDRVFQEDLPKEVAFEQRPEGREEWVMWMPREEHPRQRDSDCKGPEVGTCLAASTRAMWLT